MSFRKLAAVLLAGGLALAACGQQPPLGSNVNDTARSLWQDTRAGVVGERRS
jgi:hypothetical protein